MSSKYNKGVVLDIGCGEYKISKDAYGIDIRRTPCVDVVCDLELGLPFQNKSADVIYCLHVLEHIKELEFILGELYRILKDDGRIVIITPHFSNSLGYSDYTHKRVFGYYTFDYFSCEKSRYWWVPRYRDDIEFFILEKKLIFRNIPILGRIFGFVFNSCELFAYIYESKLSWFLPCFEIQVILTKK